MPILMKRWKLLTTLSDARRIQMSHNEIAEAIRHTGTPRMVLNIHRWIMNRLMWIKIHSKIEIHEEEKWIKVMFTFYKRIDCVHCVRNVNNARIPFKPISIEICIFVTIPLFVCESIWFPLLLLCIKHWHEWCVLQPKFDTMNFRLQLGIQAMPQHSLLRVCAEHLGVL